MQLKAKFKSSLLSWHQSWLLAIFLLFSLLALYSELLKNDPLLSYDDRPLISAASSITGLESYINAVRAGFIPDLQPVRDLSYLADLWLLKKTQFHSFHLTNLLLWWLIVVIFYHLLKHQTHPTLALAFAVFFAASPVMASSVAWVAARKHLLSTFFIACATLLCVQKKDHIYSYHYFFLVLAFYCLSVLSQPINVLWPIWFFLYTKKEFRKAPVLILFFVMGAMIFANYKYYHSDLFYGLSAIGKFNEKGFGMVTSFLSLGRYFLLCLIPFGALPQSHDSSSPQNILGLILMVMALLLFFKKIKKEKKIEDWGVLYFLLPLMVVTFNSTNVFCSDTYLLNASIGLYWSIGLSLKNSPYVKKISLLIFFYSLSACFYTHNYLKAFTSDRNLWSYTFNKEQSPQSALVMVHFYLKDKNFRRAQEIIQLMQKRWPDHPFISQVSAEAIFFDDTLSLSEKQERIEKINKPTPATHFYLVLLYARENKTAQLTRHIQQVFSNPNQLKLEFWGKEERLGAIYSYTCQFFQVKGCLELESIKESLSKDQFNEKLYQEYLQKLNRDKNYRVELKVN